MSDSQHPGLPPKEETATDNQRDHDSSSTQLASSPLRAKHTKASMQEVLHFLKTERQVPPDFQKLDKVSRKRRLHTLAQFSRNFIYEAASDTLYHLNRQDIKAENLPLRKTKVLLTKAEVVCALEDIHSHGTTGEHMGGKRTQAIIAKHYYWRTITEDVKEWISTCPECQKNKPAVPRLTPIHSPVEVLFKRPISACLSKQDQALASDVDHKFYELRTYSIKPECLGTFVQLTNQHIHLRLSYSKLIGYWLSDLGGINQVVHIWEYDNFAHRNVVRIALTEDKHWQQTYFQHISKMMMKQDNAVLKSIPDVPIKTEPRKDSGIYELWRYVMKPGGPEVFLKPFVNTLLVRAAVHERLKYGKLMGAWMTEVGDVNTAIPHDLVTKMTNQILIPLPFSPLK